MFVGLMLAVVLFADQAPPDADAPPSRPDLGGYFPVQAARAEVEGYVVLQCKVTSEGVVHGCVVVEETPAGYGFGDAGLRLSASFSMRPAAPGATGGGAVRVPLSFRNPDSKLTAGLTLDEALACHGYWAARPNLLRIGGPKYLSFLFESEVKWQARCAGSSEQAIEARLADARRTMRKRDPMPPKCGISH